MYQSQDILNLLSSLGLSKNLDEDDKGKVFRLRDLLIRSVHLVDRGANKTRFLLTKRGEDMSTDNSSGAFGSEVTENPDGSFTLVDTVEKQLSMTKAMKEAVLLSLTKSMERAAALFESVKDAQESDDAQPPAALLKEATAISDAFAAISEKFSQKADDEDEEKEDDEEKSLKVADKQEEDEEEDEDEDEDEMKATKNADGSVVIGDETFEGPLAVLAEAVIQKAGRRMARGRLSKLKDIMGNLKKLLAELDPEDMTLAKFNAALTKRHDQTQEQLEKALLQIAALRDIVAGQPLTPALIAAGTSAKPGDSVSVAKKDDKSSKDFFYNTDMFPSGSN